MTGDFTIDTIQGITIIKFNMMRATVREVQDFKNILSTVYNEGNKKIIIDLRQCNYVDSSILGVIVMNVKEIRIKGGDIRGLLSEGSMINMFTQTGLDKVFKHFTNIEDAVSSFTN